MLKQRAFYSNPCGKARQLARSRNDAMAGYNDQQRIARACAADGTRGLRLAQGGGNLAVCLRFSKGNLIQPCPHGTLKRCAVLLQRQIKRLSLSRKILCKLALRLVQYLIIIIRPFIPGRKFNPA